jgi:hypothetical protein
MVLNTGEYFFPKRRSRLLFFPLSQFPRLIPPFPSAMIGRSGLYARFIGGMKIRRPTTPRPNPIQASPSVAFNVEFPECNIMAFRVSDEYGKSCIWRQKFMHISTFRVS